jgi:benzoate-CoA ligase
MTDTFTPPQKFNFAAHVLEINSNRAGKTAYIDDLGEMSYGELGQRVRRFAAALTAIGLRREERVLLLMLDTVDWPVAFLGCLYAGVVPVAVNTLLTAQDYAYMLTDSRAQAAIVSGSLLPVMREALGRAGNLHEVRAAIVSRPLAPLEESEQDMSTVLFSHATDIVPAPTSAEEIAFWLYSSGSTGRPKGTVHTHGSPWWTAQLYGKQVLELHEDDVLFSAAKLFFAYGLGNALSFPLLVGATVVLLPDRATPGQVFKLWTTAGITVFFGAPTGYAGMLAAPDLPSRDQVRLRLCSSAGEALPREIGERFTARFGCEIIDGIGSTEMLHIFLSNRPGDVHYGTTGRAVDGYEVKLVGEDSLEVTQGDIGDLYIKGPTAALMYWGLREKSRTTFQGEWTKSGDKYLQDQNGCYVYAGRSDDMLKVSGIYVSPFEVEATLMQHPAVLESAVIGREDAEGLTKTKAFVVLKSGATASEDELKAFVKERLAPYKYPRFIEFVDDLPKTATGKIQRFRLRELDKV